MAEGASRLPSWNEVLREIGTIDQQNATDIVREKYLKKLHEITGRNVISYYSGWLQKPGLAKAQLDDDDCNGFMNCIHGMDRTLGLDLILHTPGGNIAATEAIVTYLRQMFGTNIRAIVPQLAMSAGTMIACASSQIIMGKHSSLGPTDPHINGVSCFGIIEEFKRAVEDARKDAATVPFWQMIIQKYHPTFISSCEQAIQLSQQMVASWLETGMFLGDADAASKVAVIVDKLTNTKDMKMHARHLSIDRCREIGLNVEYMEDIDKAKDFQNIVLTIHHSYMHSLAMIPSAAKIIENHNGARMVIHQQPQQPAMAYGC